MNNAAEKFVVESGVSILESCVCLDVRRSSFGQVRKINSAAQGTDAKASRIKSQKTILECPEMAAITSVLGAVTIYLQRVALPAPLRHGMYLIPVAMIDQVESKMDDFRFQLTVRVNALISALGEIKERDQLELKSEYRENDYPSAADLASEFSIESRYVEFSVPRALRSIDPALYERQVARQSQEWADAPAVIKSYLLESFKGLVDKVVERLSPEVTVSSSKLGVAAKRARDFKTFRDSLVENVREFAESFDARNVVGFDKLAEQVAVAARTIENVSGDDLRSRQGVRDQVWASMAKIQGNVSELWAQCERGIEL